MVAEAQPKTTRWLGADPRSLALGALFGLLLFVYWALIGFDPNRKYEGAPEGTEGALFAPSGSSPTLIFGVFLLLLYSRAGMLRDAVGRPALLGPSILLLGSAAAICRWAIYTGAHDLLIPSLILMLLGSGALLGGRAGLRAIWVPAVFLVFAFPLPAALVNHVVWPLQLVTAKCSAWLLDLTGFEPVRYGDMIFLGRQAFHVIETCSGMRMIQTMAMAGALYAILFYRSRSQVIAILLFAPIAGFLVNWVRVLSIILNPYSEWGSVHTIQGVVMLVVGVLLIAGFDRGLQSWIPAQGPVRRRLEPVDSERPWLRPGLLAASLLALGVANATLPVWQQSEPLASPAAFRLPAQIAGAEARGLPLDHQFLGSIGISRWLHREYELDGERVRLLVLANDRLDRRGSVLSGKTSVPGGGWELTRREPLQLEGGAYIDRSLFRGRATKRMLVYSWNEGDLSPGREILRNALALDRSPWRRNAWEVAVQISTPIEGRGREAMDAAEARLQTFTNALREAVSR